MTINRLIIMYVKHIQQIVTAAWSLHVTLRICLFYIPTSYESDKV